MKMTEAKLYIRKMQPLPYVNAATRRELFQKLLDALLVAASGMGIAAMLLLYLVLV